MWGPSIVGFGSYHYRYQSGREGDWLVTGFSPRKAAMTVYCMAGFKPHGALLAKLGRHKHSVSCLYLPRLGLIDWAVLRELITCSVQEIARLYPTLAAGGASAR